MLSVEEARERVLGTVAALDNIEIRVAEASGYALAEDVYAPHALPRFDNSAMDGYALRAQDTEGAPVTLKLVGEIRAGHPPDVDVVEGACVRIMTGAAVPAGADAIAMVEITSEDGDQVTINESVPVRRHVRPAGDDIAEGALVVPKGAELGPGELAVLASVGASPVAVVRRPRIAILVTGDELVAPEDDIDPGRIRDSNTVALNTLAAEAGGEIVMSQRVGDTREGTIAAFSDAAEAADLVISSGGVAVGKYDFVKDAVEAQGRLDMWRVAMQPGKPVVLGVLGDTPFLGLPGNPVSIHVGFEQFVRPAIRKMRGCSDLLRPTVEARLTEDLEKPAGRLHLVRVRLRPDASGWMATPTGAQGSHIQSSLVNCHGVARFPREATHMAAGDSVTVEVWRLPHEREGT